MTEWKPKFKVGDRIEYGIYNTLYVKKIDMAQKKYFVLPCDDAGYINGIDIDENANLLVNDWQVGGQHKIRRNTKTKTKTKTKRKKTIRKKTKTNRRR